jgi:hypothetical protein
MSMIQSCLDQVIAGITAADQEAAASREAFLLGPAAFQAYYDKKNAARLKQWEDNNVPSSGTGDVDLRGDRTQPFSNNEIASSAPGEPIQWTNPGIGGLVRPTA